MADRQGLPRGSVRAPVKTVAKEVQESRPDRTKQANIAEQKVGDRLAKRLAAQANCSRSQAEQYIEGGWVRVDGQVIESVGARVLAHQKIELDKNASLEALEEVTILMHKPVGFDSGEGGNPALLLLDPAKQSIDPNLAGGAAASTRFLQRHFTNLTPTTPLPFEASGLIVFTQDFRIARKLNDDADRVEQECMVQVDAKRALQGPVDRRCDLPSPRPPVPRPEFQRHSAAPHQSQHRPTYRQRALATLRLQRHPPRPNPANDRTRRPAPASHQTHPHRAHPDGRFGGG